MLANHHVAITAEAILCVKTAQTLTGYVSLRQLQRFAARNPPVEFLITQIGSGKVAVIRGQAESVATAYVDNMRGRPWTHNHPNDDARPSPQDAYGAYTEQSFGSVVTRQGLSIFPGCHPGGKRHSVNHLMAYLGALSGMDLATLLMMPLFDHPAKMMGGLVLINCLAMIAIGIKSHFSNPNLVPHAPYVFISWQDLIEKYGPDADALKLIKYMGQNFSPALSQLQPMSDEAVLEGRT